MLSKPFKNLWNPVFLWQPQIATWKKGKQQHIFWKWVFDILCLADCFQSYVFLIVLKCCWTSCFSSFTFPLLPVNPAFFGMLSEKQASRRHVSEWIDHSSKVSPKEKKGQILLLMPHHQRGRAKHRKGGRTWEVTSGISSNIRMNQVQRTHIILHFPAAASESSLFWNAVWEAGISQACQRMDRPFIKGFTKRKERSNPPAYAIRLIVPKQVRLEFTPKNKQETDNNHKTKRGPKYQTT